MLVYLIVIAVMTVLVVVVRRRAVGGRIRTDLPVVDPYATAYLAGGPRRVAAVAMADMVDAGQLAVEGRNLRRTGANDVAMDKIRAVILRGFGDETSIRGDKLLKWARRQPELNVWEEPMRHNGWLVQRARRTRNALIPVPLTLTAVAYLPILFYSLSHGSGLSVVLLSPFVVIVAVVSVGMIIGTPRQSAAGQEMVWRAARAQRRGRPDPIVVDGRPYPAASLVLAARGEFRSRYPDLATALFGTPGGD